MGFHDNWRVLLDFASLLVLGISSFTSWRMLRLQRGVAHKVDADKLEDRVSVLEQRIQTIPSHGDMTALQVRMGGVEAGIARLEAQSQGNGKALDVLTRGLEIIQEHLLDRDAK